MPQNPYFSTQAINPEHTTRPPMPGFKPEQRGKPTPPSPAYEKPMSLEQSDMMRNAQGRVPRPPNNGNPRGANNMPSWRGGGGMPPQWGGNRGNQQQGDDGWTQDPSGRMTYNPNPQRPPMMPQPQPQPPFQMNNPYYGNPYNSFNRPSWGGLNPPSQGYMGGQQSYAGRYRPPTMGGGGQWNDFGGYNYNLPNAFGSYPGYGQGNPYSPFFDLGYGGFFGLPGGGG